MAKTIVYPKVFNEIAITLGKHRTESNSALHKKDNQYDRGELAAEIDALGILAELIGQFLFFANQKEYRAAPLLADSAQSEPDIVTDIMRIDVKGVRESGDRFAVNAKAHKHSGKNISHYLFIQKIGPNVARYWWVRHEEVAGWNYMDNEHVNNRSSYFYKEIPK